MVDLVDALKAEPSGLAGKRLVEAPPAAKRAAAKKGFTMQGLRRLAVWTAAAAGALLIAALTSRSDGAVERIALVLHHRNQAVPPPFDAQAATAQLAAAVRGLKDNADHINSRLAAVERDVDDFTGSITKQIKAAAATRRADDGPSLAATAAASASTVAPVDLPSGAAAAPDTIKTAAERALPPQPRTEFGVDIGSGLTLQALRMRWATIRTAHPQLFENLEPVISVREVPRSNRIELRLVAGPIAQPGAAAQLCAQISLLGLFCQPTIFDGQHLALR